MQRVSKHLVMVYKKQSAHWRIVEIHHIWRKTSNIYTSTPIMAERMAGWWGLHRPKTIPNMGWFFCLQRSWRDSQAHHPSAIWLKWNNDRYSTWSYQKVKHIEISYRQFFKRNEYNYQRNSIIATEPVHIKSMRLFFSALASPQTSSRRMKQRKK